MKKITIALKNRKAVSTIEYSLIAALIAVAAIVNIKSVSNSIQYQYCVVSSKISSEGGIITAINSSCIKKTWLNMYGFSSDAGTESDQEIVEKCKGNAQCYAQYQSLRFKGDNEGLLNDLGAEYNPTLMPYDKNDAQNIAKNTCENDYGSNDAEPGCEATIISALSYSHNNWFPGIYYDNSK